MIPYGRQDIRPEDIEAVTEVLKSDFLTQGPAVPAFEAAICEAVSARHAVAVSSATAALHIACLALDLGPGDWLWTSPITFVASANVGIYCGAKVDFVDIDPETFNMSPDALEAKLRDAEAAGRLPKVIMPVHMAGQPCDMEKIGALARRYGIRVIEDASHGIGGRDGATPTGACAHSDIAVFSFHPVKIITTGEGGAATTNDPALAERMALLRSHGITRDPGRMTRPSEGGWYYEQLELGFNYRMTDIQAALGRSQMRHLGERIDRRHERAAVYDAAFDGWPLKRPWQRPDARSAYHLYIVRLDDGFDRGQVFAALREAGIGVNVHYIPVHLQPFWRQFGFGPGDFPSAEAYYAAAITLPLHATLSEADQSQVISAVGAALGR
ncbi:UDP-4-amino-4,6-dideoxy-N-acetyl-beta-L-altrosamine transaminase [Rhodobacterales bacterium HKCCE2091]|nr:UDP-4-amino-4,6-dideoxy-N-acetyl-beta-L-altrosamine transaminase [Rhodobacterales bacterium HKCCE2091]